jgi:hypothetical protein
MDITLNYTAATYTLTNTTSATLAGTTYTGGAINSGLGSNPGTFNGFFSGTDASHSGASYEYLTNDGNVTSGVVGYQKD